MGEAWIRAVFPVWKPRHEIRPGENHRKHIAVSRSCGLFNVRCTTGETFLFKIFKVEQLSSCLERFSVIFVCTHCLDLISGLWSRSEDHTGVSEGRPHVHCGFPSGWYWGVHQKWRHTDIRAYNGSTRVQFITFWLLDVLLHKFDKLQSNQQCWTVFWTAFNV